VHTLRHTAAMRFLDPDMYSIDGHFQDDPAWGSYVYVGGPGAG